MAKPIAHVYFHIPFCPHVCPYCSFYKHPFGSHSPGQFVDAMLAELEYRASEHTIEPETLYFGGGTPSALSPRHLEKLFSGIHRILSLDKLQEWTLEANPNTITPAKARLLREHGVTRISLGIQSWDSDVLQTLGRDHTIEQARAAYERLRAEGMPSLNIDLMFSIPGQTVSSWEQTLATTLELAPDHISAYNLTYEEDTAFMQQLQRGALDSDEERDATMFSLAMDTLEAAGYEHYEISNYALPGHESRHNFAYWLGKDYLGIGPGAVSTVERRRWRNAENTLTYLDTQIQKEHQDECLSDRELLHEALILSFRTKRGIKNEPMFQESPFVKKLLSENYLQVKSDFLRPTRKGKMILDLISLELIEEISRKLDDKKLADIVYQIRMSD